MFGTPYSIKLDGVFELDYTMLGGGASRLHNGGGHASFLKGVHRGDQPAPSQAPSFFFVNFSFKQLLLPYGKCTPPLTV